MKIIIPIHFKNERVYVLNSIFNYLFKVTPDIEIKNIPNYLILLNNHSIIEIEDHFFSKYSDNTYLKPEALPSDVVFFVSNFCSGENIPILYGKPELIFSHEKNEKFLIKFDLIACVYFMLVRWEEFVNPKKDLHNRFPLTESIAYKYNFFKRPIVNEYIEFLWNIMIKLDYSFTRVKWNFTYSLTHDVDSIFCPVPTIKQLGKILVKSHDLPGVLKTFYFQSFTNPHDSFKYLMDLSESINTRSIFYLMAGKTDKLDFEDYLNTTLFKKRINDIKTRGHLIGLHPSYNSYNNFELLYSEKLKLESSTGIEIEDVRQHFLRLEFPKTIVNQELCGFKRDSSFGYVEDIGFRCGICNEFPIFDFLSGTQLKIIEKPLIVMEGSLIHFKKLNPIQVLNEMKLIIDEVKKYNGEFIFLWHNTSFNKYAWFNYQFIYSSVLNYLNGK